VTERDHVRGPARARVTLVEYGDFQCPFCGAAYPVLAALEQRFELRFVFRHFPLTEIHPYALIAAKAAEEAGAQGKFWEMHAMLFENQRRLGPDALVRYAAALDLDVDAIAAALDGDAHEAHIRADFMGGVRSGVNGTPCLFLDDVRYDDAVEETRLTRAIEQLTSHRRAAHP
jgi:protein-disulfide isomerase